MTLVISTASLPCNDAAALPANTGSSIPQIDDAAMALLQASETAMFALTSYRAEYWASVFLWTPTAEKPRLTHYERSTLAAEKPNQMRYDKWMIARNAQQQWEQAEIPQFTFVCDGNAVWRQFGKILQKRTRVDPSALGTILEPWGGFYSVMSSPYQRAAALQVYPQIGQLLEVRRDGSEIVEGVLCEKVFVHTRMQSDGKTQEHCVTWYIGSDNLMRRQVQQVRIEGANGFVRDGIVRGIETNAPTTDPETVFVYLAPTGVVLSSDK